MQNEKEYVEIDLATASFLVVRGFKLLGLIPGGRSRYLFRFADPEENAAEVAMGYLQGETVPANALIAAEANLKTLIYSKKEKENGNERQSYRR